ncbi:MAG: hypothetical protein ACRDO8_00115 [Nocardioidaceae bacterium]
MPTDEPLFEDPPRDVLLEARAKVLHDLEVRGFADATVVSLLERTLDERRWWVEQWAEGAPFVPGLVAQDVQDTLLDSVGRWPSCRACGETAEHALCIEPPLGENPHWVCDEGGIVVAPLGSLP